MGRACSKNREKSNGYRWESQRERNHYEEEDIFDLLTLR
jgi:hypothetical protein